ncbi:MAG: hypothetical protein ACR2HP_18480 [Ilumatobacteraceae bacterium]
MRTAGVMIRGAAAGVVATVAVVLLWYRRYRADGGDGSFWTWELSTDAKDFGEDAPAPARVGKRVADLLGVKLDDSLVGPTNNVVHWLTGIGWGQTAGLAAGALPVPTLGVGLATGVDAWATSYVVLGRLGIYKPISEYDAPTLWKDLSAHLVFGLALGATLRALGVRHRR